MPLKMEPHVFIAVAPFNALQGGIIPRSSTKEAILKLLFAKHGCAFILRVNTRGLLRRGIKTF